MVEILKILKGQEIVSYEKNYTLQKEGNKGYCSQVLRAVSGQKKDHAFRLGQRQYFSAIHVA
jgi:hypothetical protein